MGLADARGPLNQHALVPLEELAGRQVEDLLAVDARVKAEVEALDRLAQIHGGPPQAEGQLLLGAPLDLVFDEALEELDVRELLR